MKRYDFIFVFDVTDANPNGDPDAGNLPRIDAETGQGLVTDVCLKRKIRNFVALTKTSEPRHEIYFTDKAVLNNTHERAYEHVGEKPVSRRLPKDQKKAQALTDFMCHNFFDIRTFDAVMSTEVNCGQVRGPVQLSFARSIDPIVTIEHAITRSSVTNVKDLEKERTMGRKFTVPYGIYRAHGFVNPFLADQTGFDEEDLELVWQAIDGAFQFDQSAARPPGSMAKRRLLVFEHDDALGNAPSHQLFEALIIRKREGVDVPRSWADYDVSLDGSRIPDGVTVLEK